MAITSDSIGLLFKAKGDTDDAKKAFSDLRSGINSEIDAITGKGSAKFAEMAQAIGLSEAAATKLSGAMGGIAIGIGAAAAVLTTELVAVTNLGQGLFHMAQSASEAGSRIKDMQDKTGLAAPLLSTLSLNAEQAGSSLEQVGGGLVKFAKNIGDATAGNDKAQASMKALGVTTTDLDAGLKQAVLTIFNAKDGTEQINLAIKAFGKSGADLIPVIKQMGGDLEAAQKEAERLGTTLSEENIRAADDFGDTLDTLSAQVRTAAERFALEFAPEITRAMSGISEAMARNQDTVREWGNAVAGAISDIVAGFEWLGSSAASIFSYINGLLGTNQTSWFNWKSAILTSILNLLGPLGQVASLLKAIGEYTKTGEQMGPYSWEMNKAVAPKFGGLGGAGKGGGKGGGGGKSDADQKAQDELRAQIELQKAALKELERVYKDTLERIRKEFKKTGDTDVFTEAANKANAELTDGANKVLEALDRLEKQALKDPTQSQRDLLLQQQNKRRGDLVLLQDKDFEQNGELIKTAVQKIFDDIEKLARQNDKAMHEIVVNRAYDDIKTVVDANTKILRNEHSTKAERIAAQDAIFTAIQNNVRVLTYENQSYYENQIDDLNEWKRKETESIEKTIADEADRQKALEAVNNEYQRKLDLINATKAAEDKKTAEAGSVPVTDDGSPGGFMDTLITGMAKGANAVKDMQGVLSTFGSMAVGVFNQVAQGVGNMVANFVLMGSAGTSFRKFVATILASVAQQAAVLAVMCLAYAALASTAIGAILLGGSPHQFLIAAAIFGAVAAGAAVVGRVVAGDSFKQQSAGEKGFASTVGNGATDGQNKGGIYSSQKDQIVEVGRNSPGSTPQVGVQLHLKLDSNGVLEVIKDSVRTNGIMRQLIVDNA